MVEVGARVPDLLPQNTRTRHEPRAKALGIFPHRHIVEGGTIDLSAFLGGGGKVGEHGLVFGQGIRREIVQKRAVNLHDVGRGGALKVL